MQPMLTAIWLFNGKSCTLLHIKHSASGGNGYTQIQQPFKQPVYTVLILMEGTATGQSHRAPWRQSLELQVHCQLAQHQGLCRSTETKRTLKNK